MPSYQSGGAFLPSGDYNPIGQWAFGPTAAASIIRPDGTASIQHTVTTTAVDGAIPIVSGIVRLTKGSAAAMTLAAPTAAQEGTTITVTTGTAFAHVVTATGLIQNGVTGGAKNTWTAAAFVGSSISLMAINLQWYVQSQNLGAVA